MNGGICKQQMSTVYIGIDPGKDGAMAIIAEDNVRVFPFSEDEYDFQLNCFNRVAKDKVAQVFCILERVGGMPGQSAPASFNFGSNFGFIRGLLKAYDVPYELVTPQKWKAEFGCTKDKNKSIEVARRLFPNVNLRRTDKCHKDHDGMAEALLMAEYARRKASGKTIKEAR